MKVDRRTKGYKEAVKRGLEMVERHFTGTERLSRNALQTTTMLLSQLGQEEAMAKVIGGVLDRERAEWHAHCRAKGWYSLVPETH